MTDQATVVRAAVVVHFIVCVARGIIAGGLVLRAPRPGCRECRE